MGADVFWSLEVEMTPAKNTPANSRGVICFTKNQVSCIQLFNSLRVYQSHDNAMVIRTSSITAAFSNIVAATMPGLFYSDWNTSIPLRLAFIIVSVIWKTLSIIMSA